MSAATMTIQRPNPTPPWPPEARGGLLYTLAVAAHRAGRKVVAGVPVIAANPRDASRLLRFLLDAANTDPEMGHNLPRARPCARQGTGVGSTARALAK